jgi:prepilin-type N-terminal cleavage/methylation domain-containing protein/prepilin-type processing-associated H-X9-DG protein
MLYTSRMMRRGFTLIELLVVISILVVLIGLLIPVSNNVRQQARSVVCQSNIHQFLVSFQAYEAANHCLPNGFDASRMPARGTGTWDIDLAGTYWVDLLGLRVKPASRDRWPGMPECPSKRQGHPRYERDSLCGNYGVNRALCTDAPLDFYTGIYTSAYARPPVSTSSLRHHSSTFLIVDSGYALICWWHAMSSPPVKLTDEAVDTAYIPGLSANKDRLFRPGQILDAMGGRHPNKTVNVGFADYHAERKKAEDLLVERIDPNTYANKTPLWEPR